MKATQEPLPLTEDRPWRIDEHTREVGRRGLAGARAALEAARRRADFSLTEQEPSLARPAGAGHQHHQAA